MLSSISEPASNDEGEVHFAGICWDKPYILARDSFETVAHFLYACVWSDFVVAETRAEQQHVNEELQGAERLDALIRSGQCVSGAQAYKIEDQCCLLKWSKKQGTRLRVNNYMVISRIDPDVDGWKHIAKIAEISGGNSCVLKFLNGTFPSDILEGEWRLDVSYTDHFVLYIYIYILRERERCIESTSNPAGFSRVREAAQEVRPSIVR